MKKIIIPFAFVAIAASTILLACTKENPMSGQNSLGRSTQILWPDSVTKKSATSNRSSQTGIIIILDTVTKKSITRP